MSSFSKQRCLLGLLCVCLCLFGHLCFFLLFISLAFCSLWGHLKAKLAFVLYRSIHGLKAKFAYVLYRELYRPHALFEGKVCLCYIGDGSCSDCNSCNGLKDGRLYLRKSFQTPSTSTNHIFLNPSTNHLIQISGKFFATSS